MDNVTLINEITRIRNLIREINSELRFPESDVAFTSTENMFLALKSNLEQHKYKFISNVSSPKYIASIDNYRKIITKYLSNNKMHINVLNKLKILDGLIESFNKSFELINSYLEEKNLQDINLSNYQIINDKYEELSNGIELLKQKTQSIEMIFKKKLDDFQFFIEDESTKILELSSKTERDLKERISNIDKLLGQVSGRALAGDYQNSAKYEKKIADWMRYASLVLMFLIVLIVSISFWDSTRDSFDWEKSIFRLVLAFMLSIPSAYLARESAKHRIKQYSHHQTSLELTAIKPYIASLPEADQHKLKIQIAGKLFGSTDPLKSSSDHYPVNTQEIMMAIIEKLDYKNK